jgi:hypothetical protein
MPYYLMMVSTKSKSGSLTQTPRMADLYPMINPTNTVAS